jgi:hypothetical protein
VLDHRADLESDFSAIHHIYIDIEEDDFSGLSANRFFALAERIPAYAGVMQAILLNEEHRKRERVGGAKVVDLTPEMVQSGQALEGLDGLIEWG